MIRLRRTVLTLGTSAALVLAAAPGASALGPYPQNPARSGEAGVVSTSEPMELVGGNGAWRANATKFTYSSTDSMGRASIDRATFIEPRAPWTSPGPRPLVAIAPGTQGPGEHCDPSNTAATGITATMTPPDAGFGYELLPAAEHLSRGAAVVVIDHHRNPDTGSQEYVDNISSGQSLLDAAIAARGLGVDAAAPVGLHGYSQGGGTSGWAAENAHLYAPDLNVVASTVGAPPSDLLEVLDTIDGSILTAAVAYAINGVLSKDPELRAKVYEEELNDAGRAWLDASDGLCIGGSIIDSGFRTTRDFTADGSSLKEVLDARYPEVLVELERQKLGKSVPDHPTMLYAGVSDDIIPVNQIRELNAEWSAKGADLIYVEDTTPAIPGRLAVNHIAPMLSQLIPAIDFMWSHLAPEASTPIPGVPGSLSPQLPELPGLPGAGSSGAEQSGAPEALADPGVPAAPAAPGLPQQAAIPGLPQLPGLGFGGA